MEFKTKYNTDTSVWLMVDNKPKEFNINEIHIKYCPDANHIKMITEILYGIGSKSNCYEPISYLKSEDDIFTSKEDLLNSL